MLRRRMELYLTHVLLVRVVVQILGEHFRRRRTQIHDIFYTEDP